MAICICCKGEYDPKAEPPLCERCDTDLTEWEKEKAKTRCLKLCDFFSSSWGILTIIALISPLLIIPFWLGLPITLPDWFADCSRDEYILWLAQNGVAILFSAIAIAFVYSRRFSLREYEWARRAKIGRKPSPTAIAFVALGLFAVAAVAYSYIQYFGMPGPPHLLGADKDEVMASLVLPPLYVFIFTTLSLGTALLAAKEFANKLDDVLPRPLFAAEDKLIKVVIKSVNKKLALHEEEQDEPKPDQAGQGTGNTKTGAEAQKLSMVEHLPGTSVAFDSLIERTKGGGIKLILIRKDKRILFRREEPEELKEARSFFVERRFEVEADKWGNLLYFRELPQRR